MPESFPAALPGKNPSARLLPVALRLLWRDWRSGELRLLVAALVLAVTSVTAIALFTDRLEQALLLESANMLAADRIISGSGELPAEVMAEARSRGLRTATTLTFTSMAFSDESNLLVAAKAVTDGYPLRGEMIVAEQAFTRGTPVDGGPVAGEVWLESRALAALGLAVGETVFVGEAALRVGKIIIAEPDRAGGNMLNNIGPRLMLHMDDVAATAVVQPGSRVSWRYLFAGDDPTAVEGFEQWFRARDPWQGRFSVRDIRDESQEVSDALERAEGFLLLGALFAVVLAGVAIALAARRYSERHYDCVAILKTLGCTSGQISLIYLAIQLLLALLAMVPGFVLGTLVHFGILQLLRSLLQTSLPAAGLQPYVIGALTALVCLLAFALPPLLALGQTPPLRVLRRDLAQPGFNNWLPYGLGMVGTVGLIYWFSQDLALTAVLVSAVLGIACVLSLVSWMLLKSGGSVGMKAGSAWKLAMTAVRRRRGQHVVQVTVFSVTIMALLVLTLLRTDLVVEWRAQLPRDTPNHFLLNITGNQIRGIETFLADNGIQANAFYPLISARITRINGLDPAPTGNPDDIGDSRLTGTAGPQEREPGTGAEGSAASQEKPTEAAGATASEGSRPGGRLGRRQVSWAAELPPENQVTAGEWWDENSRPGYVSVEQEYADWLDLQLGDQLEFEINQQLVRAEVSSLRSVRWDNMQPNFFLIFSPGTIDHLAGTYLSSALLEQDQKLLLNQLIRLFPTLVVIEVDALIEQIQLIIARVTSAIELITVLVLLCGALVLLSCINATLDERYHESAILRTLGAGRKLILSSLVIEFAFIGLLAGLLASLGAEATLYYLQREMFRQEFSFHYWVWPVGSLLGMFVTGALGVASTLSVVRVSPLQVLRRTAG